MSSDPFGTAALRTAVLASWADSPTRFREDANAEEDLLLGGYADRWFVELAQNAADAAQRAGTAGNLLLRAVGTELRVANTGVPLDVEGVTALASLRASAKRDTDAVGRFGVGFAAVLGVSAEPRVVSAEAGVAFSAQRTAKAVRELGGAAAAELDRRDGRPPVLRLCWPVEAEQLPDGYDTEVQLPVEDANALLTEADAAAPDLLLALPWLTEITVNFPDGAITHSRHDDGPSVTLSRQEAKSRWLLLRRSSALVSVESGSLYSSHTQHSRAVEDRDGWSVCWALPLDADGAPAPLDEDVLHAPTPSDERLALPARLFATLPMQPSRRRIRTGPATDAVLAEAARAYLDLVRALPAEQRIAIVPSTGFPRSELDSALHAAIDEVLRGSRWLPSARPGGEDLSPKEGVLLDQPGLTDLLGDVLPGLLAESLIGRRTELAAIGVRALPLSELADRLAGVRRSPTWWRDLYTVLEPALDAPGARDELAALPVPLVDGRTVTGPRTALMLTDEMPEAADEVDLPGLRIVASDAVHPLLRRLGATEAGPAELLDHDAITEAVGRSVADAEDGADPRPLSTLVLGLLEVVGDGNRPWLAALALPDVDGEPCRADELMFTDAAIAPLLEEDAPLAVLAEDVAAAHPRRVLIAAGVLDSFARVVDEQPTGPDHDLDDEEQWWDALPEPPSRLVAIRDLDLVRDDAWPVALALLASDPEFRPALRRDHPSDPEPYTTWWLARHSELAGHAPSHWRLGEATDLAGLFDPAPAEKPQPTSDPLRAGRPILDDALLAAIGVRTELTVRDEDAAEDLLDRLGDPHRTPDAALTWRAHSALADAVLAGRVDPADLDPPTRLRSSAGSAVDADRAVLLDRPWLVPALPAAETITGRLDQDGLDALAELLDLPLASEIVAGSVIGTGTATAWADLPEVVAACASVGIDVPDGGLRCHESLGIELTRPERRRLEVPVWREDGIWHAADPVRALLMEVAVRIREQS